MFAVRHSDINSLKSGLLHLTGQPYCKKNRSAKVKDGIINSILRNFLIYQYNDRDELDTKAELHADTEREKEETQRQRDT